MKRIVETGRIALVGVAVMLGGCQTTAYRAEVEQSAAEVGRHSGWTPRWSAPWGEKVAAWDGRSPLSVDQAVTIALENNRGIRAEVETIGTARADFVQAGLLPNPVVSFQYRFAAGGLTPVTDAAFLQPIAELWLIPARVEAAKAGLRQAVLHVSSQALELIAKVKSTHARVVYGQARVALAGSEAGLLQRTREIVEARFKAGGVRQLDESRVILEQLLIRDEARVAEAELRTAKQELLELMGLAAGPMEWEAAATGTGEAEAAGVPDDAGVIAAAVSQRLDVRAAEWSYKAQVQRLREQKFELRDVGLGPSFEHADPHAYTLGPAVELTVPLFDQNQARIAAAQADLDRLYSAAAAQQQQAIREARQALAQYAAAWERVELYRREVLPLLERSAPEAKRRFDAGQESVTTVLDVYRQAIQARQNQLSALRDLALARAELERAVGGRLVLRGKAGR